jgi:hypothetical protein
MTTDRITSIRDAERSALHGIEPLNAPHGDVEQPVQLSAVERAVLTGALHFDESPFTAHDDIHVHGCTNVFVVIEIEAWLSVHHADADGRNATPDWRMQNATGVHQPFARIDNRNARTRDCRRSRSAICLQDIAIDANGELTEPEIIEHGANAAPDEALNLLGPAAKLRTLAVGSGARCARKHCVFRREPTQSGATTPAGHTVLDGRRAQHARLSESDEAAALGVRCGATFEYNVAQGIGRATDAFCNLRISHEVFR